MRFPSLCLLAGAFLGLGCSASDRGSPPLPSAGAAGSPAWHALDIDAGGGAGAEAPPLTDAELDRMLDALERQIDRK